ncbi:hypothetical protein ACHWQZ_G013766 [Mnemiopsis leidyi]
MHQERATQRLVAETGSQIGDLNAVFSLCQFAEGITLTEPCSFRNGQHSDERKIYALEQNRILLNQSLKDTYSRIVNPPI